MKKIKFIVATAFIAFVSLSYTIAQNNFVSGIVVDSDSLYSISGVNIYLLDANQKQKVVFRTKTNNKGMFSFVNVAKGTYQIRTVASGYKVMISKKFELLDESKKYNYKLKINNLTKGEADTFTDIDYNDYLDLLEDRDVINEDK